MNTGTGGGQPPAQDSSRRSVPVLVLSLTVFLAFAAAGCGHRRATRQRSQMLVRPPASEVGCAPGDDSLRPPGPYGIRFQDVGARSGLSYCWPLQPRPIPALAAFGCGCAFLDYDNDGFQDILLVARPHPVLYRNLGNGRFQDVTHAVGLDMLKGYWTGCAVGDYDSNGYLDVLLTGYQRLALLRNEHGARFVDVTSQAGLKPDNNGLWGASAGFMDLAGRGYLDLVVLNYAIYTGGAPHYCELMPGLKTGCPPSTYKPEFAEMFQNLGNGSFKDVTASSGMKTTHGRELVLAFVDVDHNGRQSLYIGDDGLPGDLMHNEGGMHFRNTGVSSGVAFAELDHAIAGMGADWADYDRDGEMDLIVSAFSDESFAFFHNLGHGQFTEVADALGVAGPSLKPLAFGAKWIDVDNDGWPDAAFACGHVYDAVNRIDAASTFRQPQMLFHNHQGRNFQDLVPKLGGPLARPILGRGSASGDFDNDGRMDLLVVDFEGRPVLLHNLTVHQNHWITLDLHGSPPNLFAYGAEVTMHAGHALWVGEVSPASSYLSSSDPRIHFGLGKTLTLDSIDIRWPDGRREQLHGVEGDGILRIQEEKGIVGTDARARL